MEYGYPIWYPIPVREFCEVSAYHRMGFMMTGGPAVRGQAWNLASVACHHFLSETVLGMLPIPENEAS